MALRNFAGKLQVFSVNDNNDGSYVIQGLFQDETSTYASTDLQLNYTFVDNRGEKYEITVINGNGSILNFVATGDSMPVTGAGMVYDPSCTDAPMPPSGLPNDLDNFMVHDQINILSNLICGLSGAIDVSVSGGTVNGTNLELVNNSGGTISIDLSDVFDDTNLARIVSGNVSGSTLTLVRDDSSVITIDVSDLQMPSVVFTDNGDGTFTIVDNDGNSTNFDANTPANQSSVTPIGDLTGTTVQQILEELYNQQDVHIDNYSISGTTFIGTLNDGTQITVDLLSAIQAGETITNLVYTGTVLTYTNEAGDIVRIDLANLTTDIYVDGADFDSSTLILTLVDNDGDTPNVQVDLGALVSNYVNNGDGTFTLIGGSGSTITIDTNASALPFNDTNVSFTANNVQTAIENIFNSIQADTNDFVTGATFSSNILTLNVSNQADVNVDLSSLSTDNYFVTGSTFSNGTLTISLNDGNDYNVDLSSLNPPIVDNQDGTYTHTNFSGGTTVIDTNAASSNVTPINGYTGGTVQEVLEEISLEKYRYTFRIGNALFKASTKNITYNLANGIHTITMPDGHTIDYASLPATQSDLTAQNMIEVHVVYSGTEQDYSTPNIGQFSALMPVHIGVIDRSIDFQTAGDASAASGSAPYVYNQGTVAKSREVYEVSNGAMKLRIKDMDSFVRHTVIVSW